MSISIIACIGIKGELGKNNQLIWKPPYDLKGYKKLTVGKTVVMGRKTFETIGKPLPKRTNIILTKTFSTKIKGCYQTSDIKDILNIKDDVYILGGQQIYELFMPHADELIITHVNKTCDDADSFFPRILAKDWEMQEVVGVTSDMIILRYKTKKTKK